MCSADLKTFIDENHLTLTENGTFNPRLAFGSHSDADHVYNTPRMWYGQRYFNPTTVRWQGENAQFTPSSDDMPWYRKPEHLITVDDVKYVLSSNYQGTPYDPYTSSPEGKLYRPIGINRTAFVSLSQISSHLPKDVAAIQWFSYGCNVYNALVPQFTNIRSVPDYFSGTTLNVSTDSYYWNCRLISALADPYHGQTIVDVERYQQAVGSKVRTLIRQTIHGAADQSDIHEYLEKANQQIADVVSKQTADLLNTVLIESTSLMTNSYSRSDQ